MIKLRKAQISESRKILKFYRNLIFSIKGSEFKPKWNDNYPDLEFIETSILKEELFVYGDDEIIGCAVVNDEFGDEYNDIKWHADAKPCETTVIHAFAVNGRGNGIGKEIFNQIVTCAIENGKKTIRIDIIDGNEGAKKVFKSWGFEYVDSIEVFHHAVGLETFHLYEKALE